MPVHFSSYRKSVSQTTMVYPIIENVYTRSHFNSSISQSFYRPKPKPTPTALESNMSLSKMEGLRKQYSAEVSSDQKWGSLFLSRQIDPISASEKFLLEFFSDLFSEGLEYRTINGYRSELHQLIMRKLREFPIG